MNTNKSILAWWMLIATCLVLAGAAVFVSWQKSSYPVSYGIVNPEKKVEGTEYGTIFFGGNTGHKYAGYNDAKLLIYVGKKLAKVKASVTFSRRSDYDAVNDDYLKKIFEGSIKNMVAVHVRTVLFFDSAIPGKNGLKLKGSLTKKDLSDMLLKLNAPEYGAGSENGPVESFLTEDVKITGIIIHSVEY